MSESQTLNKFPLCSSKADRDWFGVKSVGGKWFSEILIASRGQIKSSAGGTLKWLSDKEKKKDGGRKGSCDLTTEEAICDYLSIFQPF